MKKELKYKILSETLCGNKCFRVYFQSKFGTWMPTLVVHSTKAIAKSYINLVCR